jgi:hypothetical protein
MKAHVLIVVIASLLATPLAGCATAVGPHQIDVTSDGPVPSESNWSRVGELSPGAEIVLTRRGSQAASRRFVSADDAAVTVLNLTDPSLPEAAARVLRDMASQRPESFAAMRNSGATFGQGDVRIGGGGLFVDGRRITAFESVVERVARNDVGEIFGPVVARGSVGGAVLGGWLGFSAGAAFALGGASEGIALVVAGVVLGAFLGHRWSSHQTYDLVYRAR